MSKIKRQSAEQVIGALKSTLLAIEPRSVRSRAIRDAIYYLEGNPIPGTHCGANEDFRKCEAPDHCSHYGTCGRA